MRARDPDRILKWVGTTVFWTCVLLQLLFFGSKTHAAEPAANLSGFSGYAWGTPRATVRAELKAEGFQDVELIAHSDWYAGVVAKHQVTFGYVYDDADRLIGGSWDFKEISPVAFMAAYFELAKSYGKRTCTPFGCGQTLEAPTFAGDEQYFTIVVGDTEITERMHTDQFLTVIFKRKS